MQLQDHKGNVLFMILIAAALFAALSFAFTQGGRGSASVDKENQALLAIEIIQHADAVVNAVKQLKLTRRCTDTQISFQSTSTGVNYANPSAPANKSCHVFDAAGGGVTPMVPNTKLLDPAKSASPLYGTIYFTGQSNAHNVGTSPSCADPAYSSGKELIMFVPYLTQANCLSIGRQMGRLTSGGAIPQIINIAYDNRPGLAVPFRGVYANNGWCGMGVGNAAAFDGQLNGCFKGDVLPESDVYTFYQVLIAR